MCNSMVCLLTLSVLALSVVAHEPGLSGEVSDVRRDERIPCYVVISNEARDDNERKIRVLIDKSDVTEAKFVRLHRHFSAMYPDVERLYVYVSTSLNFTLGNYTTVEDIERRQAGLPPKPKIWEKDAQGILMRTAGMEKFGYKAEGGDLSDMRYILVKGEDPYCNDCKRLEASLSDSEDGGASALRKIDGDIPCYFVIGDFAMNGRRFIRLFINVEDGSEPNLLKLLRSFARQHPEPEPLVIKVYTNLRQEYDFLVPNVGEYFVAALFRDDGNEVIRYQRPHEKLITIVVRGVDTFPDLNDYQGTEGRRVP